MAFGNVQSGCLLEVINKPKHIPEVSGDMAFAVPQYSRREVNHAGECLIADPNVVWIANRDQMLAIINNWRSSHAFPLQSFKMTLLSRAKKENRRPIVAQRLKRFPSIELKLRRFKDMRLAQMQDLGGCRAVVSSIRRLESLIELYEDRKSTRLHSSH